MPRAGVRIVHNQFPRLAVTLPPAVDRVCSETATLIEQDVKGGPHAAPYETGNLRRSYHKKKVADGYEVGNDPGVADYAVHQEYGTHKMAAQPHLRPSVEAQREPFKRKLRAALLRGRRRS